jgi:hypothetical protein
MRNALGRLSRGLPPINNTRATLRRPFVLTSGAQPPRLTTRHYYGSSYRDSSTSTPGAPTQDQQPRSMDGVGAWGAWQVEPAGFTKLVVESMRML